MSPVRATSPAIGPSPSMPATSGSPGRARSSKPGFRERSHPMRPALILIVLAVALLAAAPAGSDEPANIPAKAQTVLDKAAEVEVWSLEPEREKDPAKGSF